MSPAPAPRPLPPSTGRSSASQAESSPTNAEVFGLNGPSNPPDPDFHAYRSDLADVRLAGRVVASHFVGGIDRHVVADSALRAGPGEDSPVVAQLAAGDRFELLDDTLGWAWGYAGDERRVGYVESRALTA